MVRGLDQSNKLMSVLSCICPVIDHEFHHNIVKVSGVPRAKWICRHNLIIWKANLLNSKSNHYSSRNISRVMHHIFRKDYKKIQQTKHLDIKTSNNNGVPNNDFFLSFVILLFENTKNSYEKSTTFY